MIESGDIVKWAGRDGDFSVIGIYEGKATLRKIGEVNKPSYNADVNDLTVIQKVSREYRYPLTSSIIRKAISFGAITAEQANSKAVIEAAEEVAYNHIDDEEIGSSDMTFILKEFLDEIGLETYWDNSRLAFRGTVNVAAKGKKVADADKFYADLKKNAGWYCMDTAADKKKFIKWLEANCSKHGLDCKKAVSMVQKNDSWCTDNDEDMGWFIKHAFGIETKEYKEAVENDYYAANGVGVREYGTWKVTFQDNVEDTLTWSEYAYANSEKQAIARSAESLNLKYPRYDFRKMKVVSAEEVENNGWYKGQSIILNSVTTPNEDRFLGKEIIIEKVEDDKIIKSFVRSTGEKVPFVIDSKKYSFTNYANGGFVSKAELVWKKLSASKRMEFLSENFTPEITPRSQELLAGKEYQFLPKNVKIKLAAKYADVEDYAAKGRQLKDYPSPSEIEKIKDYVGGKYGWGDSRGFSIE